MSAHAATSRIRIAVDAHRLMCEPQTSGATYLRALLRDWGRRPDATELFLLFPAPPSSELAAQPELAAPNFHLVHPAAAVDPIASYRAQFSWQQRTVASLIRKVRPDVYFSPFHLTPQLPARQRMVTTIHDLCFLTEPWFTLGSIIHCAQVWTACARSARLICISRFTFGMLEKWAPRFARKARVVHNGTHAAQVSASEARSRVAGLDGGLAPRKYLLWVGSPSPRKNPELLFAVFRAHHARFPGDKFVLVAPASAHAELRGLARDRGIEPELRLFAALDNVSRDALYRCALALVFPSKCEGFGYPVLEGMFQGCPPVSFLHSPASELAGSAVPLAEEPTAEAFMKILGPLADSGEEERNRLEAALAARAQEFSCEAMAKGTLEVLREGARMKDEG
jgi:glycosyltransferase involved in cell wall biosynthesis